jgi:hypothetical protein
VSRLRKFRSWTPAAARRGHRPPEQETPPTRRPDGPPPTQGVIIALTEVGARLKLQGSTPFSKGAKNSAESLAKLGRQAGRADRKVTGLERAAKRTRSALGGMAKVAGKAGLAGVAAAGVAIPVLGKSLLETATQMEALEQKSKTVFGDSLTDVQKWADTSASKMGLSAMQATGLAASFGDLLVPMGFTRKRAADLSTETLNLAGALSQWSGGQRSASEVADILTAAMLGETDSLKGLGIAISAAEVDARLAANGQKKLTGAALQQAKAVATQELILAKSGDAQAAYATGGLKLAAVQARLKASFQTTREKMAALAAPHLLRWIEGFERRLPAIGQALQDFASGALPPIREGLRSFGDSMERIGDRLGGLSKLDGKAKGTGEAIGKLVGGLIEFAGKAAELWVRVQADLFRFVRSSIDLVSKLTGSLSSTFASLSKLPVVGGHFRAAASGLAEVAAGTQALGVALDEMMKPRTVTYSVVYDAARAAGAAPGVARAEAAMARGGRARGGPVSPGQAYRVGEYGPEIFVPQTAGRISNREQAASVLAPQQHIEVHATFNGYTGGPQDADRLVEAVRKGVRQELARR